MRLTAAVGLIVSFCLSANLNAAMLTFLGQDTGLGENTRLAAHPNSDTARANFFANLAGVGTENFESFANGAGGPLAVNFGMAGTATLTGSGSVTNVPVGTNGFGRYPISGNQYWEAGSTFSLSFSGAVAAFGFYATDIGDFNGQVTLTLVSGGTTTVNIGNATNVIGGGVLYFGLIVDPGQEFTAINFGNTQGGTDAFGFDDFSIGSRQQVQLVPEPATMLVWGLGVLTCCGITAVKRRKDSVNRTKD